MGLGSSSLRLRIGTQARLQKEIAMHDSPEPMDEPTETMDGQSATGSRPRALASRPSNQTDQVGTQTLQAQRMESLGQLAGGIAHDFNNLLAVILSYSTFACEDLADESKSDWPTRLQSVRDDLGQVSLAAERAARLTRQLLAFARREVVQPQVINLNLVIAGLEDMLRHTLGEHIELVTSLSDDLWSILADPGEIEQVLVNLVVNARDAMPKGGTLTINTSNTSVESDAVARTSEAKEVQSIRMSVSDTGIGMSAETIDHVYEPFFTTKAIGEGTGLGLSTVYGILAAAEGHITIDSQPGVGTSISVTWPMTTQVAFVLPEIAPDHRVPEGELVLVVEDEEALREITRRILTRNGYRVLPAADGQEAIDIARSHEGDIHLLVTDVMLPKMLGKEVAEQIQRIVPEIKVLFMSGYAQPVLASQGRLEPNVTLLEKPFSEAELIAKVTQVLNGYFPGYHNVAPSAA
jgi:signal transduction histidine kinase/CheY-like chemotaxis protein